MHADAARLVARWLPMQDRVAMLTVKTSPELRRVVIDAAPWDVETRAFLLESLALAPQEWRWLMERVTSVKIDRRGFPYQLIRSENLVHLRRIRHLALTAASSADFELLRAMPWLASVVIGKFCGKSAAQPKVTLPGLERLDVPESVVPLVTAPDLTTLLIRPCGMRRCRVFALPKRWSWARDFPRVRKVYLRATLMLGDTISLWLPRTVTTLAVHCAHGAPGTIRVFCPGGEVYVGVGEWCQPNWPDPESAIEIHEAAAVRVGVHASAWTASGIPRTSWPGRCVDDRQWTSTVDVPRLFF